ncbi:hypothetical protein Patl1_23232 [Pistacia atlantica]|uniref:Uncharacterized protein n=1 Tax=Pistacia atlantica TaxID=434234 RepID=A0ACC1A1S6_9ROSI|nr:hypothetical protein Patl1_23232 [Pistacia atlantica]
MTTSYIYLNMVCLANHLMKLSGLPGSFSKEKILASTTLHLTIARILHPIVKQAFVYVLKGNRLSRQCVFF